MWKFVSLSEYSVPSLPARSAVATAWAWITQLFTHRGQDATDFVRDEKELNALGSSRLERLFRPVDLSPAAAALDQRVSFPAERGAVQFVVAQPSSQTRKIVRRWAEQHDARVVSSPDPSDVLHGTSDWLHRQTFSGQPWVLLNLEDCFLRHAAGLATVRNLLEQAEAGCLGHGIICCDSWAWAYLQAVWPIPESEAVTLQAFDGSQFAGLLMDLVRPRSEGSIHFRDATTGKDILTVPSDNGSVTEEIAELMARSRGNVGLALDQWRERLRTEPEADVTTDGDETGEHKDDVETAADDNVWVSGFSELSLPVDTDEDTGLVLHALLLHGGLPDSMLPETLPLSRARCSELLFELQGAGFVRRFPDRWLVDSKAYPGVRRFLSGRGYLVDRF